MECMASIVVLKKFCSQDFISTAESIDIMKKKKKKKNMCVSGFRLEKIRYGRSDLTFYFSHFFYSIGDA